MLFFFKKKIHTAFKLYSLWHVGYLFDDFYGFDMCSRVGLLPYNPARRPAIIKAPRLFGLNALLLVLACGRNNWPSCPALSIIPIPFSYYRLNASIDGDVRCLVYTVSPWGLPTGAGNKP
jgi:hypothetical protein